MLLLVFQDFVFLCEKCIETAFILNEKILSLTNLRSSIVFDDKKLKKLMDYANKIKAKNVIIIGEDELLNSQYTFKNMETGLQTLYTEDDLLSFLKTI